MESDVYDGKRWFCEKSWLMCRYLFFAVLKNLEKIPKITSQTGYSVLQR